MRSRTGRLRRGLPSAAGCLLALAVAAALLAGCVEADGPEPAARAWVLLDSSHGIILLEIYDDLTPVTAANFLNLTRTGFYDGTRFHRVVGPSAELPQGFMVQGGDPLSRDEAERERWGFGGSDPIPDEFPRGPDGELLLRHDRAGVLSMANRGPGTGSSQFFITLGPTEWLDGGHTIFGHVVGGQATVRSIGSTPTDGERPVNDVMLHQATVVPR